MHKCLHLWPNKIDFFADIQIMEPADVILIKNLRRVKWYACMEDYMGMVCVGLLEIWDHIPGILLEESMNGWKSVKR